MCGWLGSMAHVSPLLEWMECRLLRVSGTPLHVSARVASARGSDASPRSRGRRASAVPDAEREHAAIRPACAQSLFATHGRHLEGQRAMVRHHDLDRPEPYVAAGRCNDPHRSACRCPGRHPRVRATYARAGPSWVGRAPGLVRRARACSTQQAGRARATGGLRRRDGQRQSGRRDTSGSARWLRNGGSPSQAAFVAHVSKRDGGRMGAQHTIACPRRAPVFMVAWETNAPRRARIASLRR